MITFTRVKGLSHANVAEKGPEFPARLDRLSDNRALRSPLIHKLRHEVRGRISAKREVIERRAEAATKKVVNRAATAPVRAVARAARANSGGECGGRAHEFFRDTRRA